MDGQKLQQIIFFVYMAQQDLVKPIFQKYGWKNQMLLFSIV